MLAFVLWLLAIKRDETMVIDETLNKLKERALRFFG